MYYATLSESDPRIVRTHGRITGPIAAGSIPTEAVGTTVDYPFALYVLDRPEGEVTTDGWGMTHAAAWRIRDRRPGYSVFGLHGSYVDGLLQALTERRDFNAVTAQRTTWALIDALRDTTWGRDDTLENVIATLRDELVKEGQRRRLGPECVVAQRLMTTLLRRCGIEALTLAEQTSVTMLLRTAILWAVVRGKDNPFADTATLIALGASPAIVANDLRWVVVPREPGDQRLVGHARLVALARTA